MNVKSKEKAFLRSLKTTDTNSFKRGRGRPKGSKNKPKDSNPPVVVDKIAKKRGRPKGSKNKPKDSEVEIVTEAKQSSSLIAAEKEAHPLLQAAEWLEKYMSVVELAHYRRRAAKNEMSLHCAMVHDILGIFNVRDPEICKQLKKQ
jgi:hypothetical protein